MVLLRSAPRGHESNDTGVRFDLACETDPVERRPRRYVTLEGYAVEGGLDGPYQPSTCFRPTIALGRHVGPGEADDLWHDYERVLDLVPAMGFDGVRLSVEWARVEPHRGQVDETALERYAEVARYAHSLGLGVTVVIVDAAWPAWLGLEAWLLPWVAPLVVEHASRVVQSIDAASGVVVFADPASLVNGFLVSSAPPWRRGAGVDADMARAQIATITAAIRDDPLVGPKIVASTSEVSAGSDLSTIRATFDTDCDEVYVRSLVRGYGPTKCAGLLMKNADGWQLPTSAALLDVLR
jgi:beta-glucosidase/6-phospho-beta-glucosidase/beta-galactosidase